MASLGSRRGLAALTQQQFVRGISSSASFAEQFRASVASVPIKSGDRVMGHIVGKRKPRSTSSEFSVVDFGLKCEAPFSGKETPGATSIGDSVSKTLLEIEDDFNEPVFDHSEQSKLPSLLAERYRVLMQAKSENPQFLYGRFSSVKRGGASAKVLGVDAFAPRHHVVTLKRPVVGSYAPFFLLSMATTKRPRIPNSVPGLEVNPVVSSYGGYVFSLANLVGIDEAWEASGGGSNFERVAYLRLLTKILMHKNSMLREAVPRVPRVLPFRSRHGTSRRSGSFEDTGGTVTDAQTGMRWLDSPDLSQIWDSGLSKSRGQPRTRGSAVVGTIRNTNRQALQSRSPRRDWQPRKRPVREGEAGSPSDRLREVILPNKGDGGDESTER